MKPEYINPTLMPPEEKSKWLLEREAFEEKALNWVKYCFRDNPSEIFDLYDHDREVAIAFKTFVSRYMNGELTEGEPDRNISDNVLWEIYCTETKK